MNKQLKIGIVVTITLAATIWGFNFMKGFNLFDDNRTYHAVYDRVEGIVETNPVIYSGFKVGQVSEVKLVKDSLGVDRVKVSFVVTDEGIIVTDKTIARIISSDIMGAKAIELDSIYRSTVVAPNGSELTPDIEKGLQEVINAQILPLKTKTEELIGSANQVILGFQEVMNEETKNNLIKAFARIPLAIRSLENATYTVDTTINESRTKLNILFDNVNSITRNLRDNGVAITAVIENVESITDSLDKANIKQTFDQLAGVAEKTNSIIEKIDNGEGSLGMLVNDEKLHNELMMASLKLNMLIEDIKVNPHRYIHVSAIDFHRNKSKSNPGLDSTMLKDMLLKDKEMLDAARRLINKMDTCCAKKND